MKLQSLKTASLSAILLISPLTTFAAGQPKQHPSDARNNVASQANTLHLRKAVETLKRETQSGPKRSDSAFRK
jgi:hypothetical protein